MAHDPHKRIASRRKKTRTAAHNAPAQPVSPESRAQLADPLAAPEVAAVADPGLLSNFVVTRRQRQRLDIDLICGSITEVRADAYVIGVFRNVTPGGAAGDIDRELGGALKELVARRMVSGEAGEITSFPTGGHRFGANSVILAGLGAIDTYASGAGGPLELVGENIMRTALLTRLDDFAIVPLGAASGSGTGAALKKLLRGFVRALGTAPDGRLRGFSICELDPHRFEELRQAFYSILRTDLFGEVEVTLNELRAPPPVVARGIAAPPPQAVYRRAAAPGGVPLGARGDRRGRRGERRRVGSHCGGQGRDPPRPSADRRSSHGPAGAKGGDFWSARRQRKDVWN
jgi:hypothetical protein